MPEELSKRDLRHWIDAVSTQLEMVHKWKHADLVLDRVKRSKVEITRDVLTSCVAEAIDEAASMEGYEVLEDADYVFADKSKFLHAYLVGKLNTDLHERTVGITGKNGFETYRQVCQISDAVPENADFFMNAELQNLVSRHVSKVTDLKTLYGFRLLLKKKNAEFKKIVGKEPEDSQSKMILWNVLDPASRLQAKTDKVDAMTYQGMYEWIDLRYKITFGNLDYKPTKDDPMGLAVIDKAHPMETPNPPPGIAEPSYPDTAELDAMRKGKGKVKGDGKCHVCGGDGHFARDCPSVPPIGPQAVECMGCNGRGHYRNQCPTHNPHLKSKGKGKGKGGWEKGAGKGKGGGNGKGKGGKGKGMSALDLMGSW